MKTSAKILPFLFLFSSFSAFALDHSISCKMTTKIEENLTLVDKVLAQDKITFKGNQAGILELKTMSYSGFAYFPPTGQSYIYLTRTQTNQVARAELMDAPKKKFNLSVTLGELDGPTSDAQGFLALSSGVTSLSCDFK